MARVTTTRRSFPRRQQIDPLPHLFRLLTSVRFAVGLITTLVIVTLAGVFIPQVPEEIRNQPALRDAWVADQEDRYGALAPMFERLHLFEVFASPWFTALLGVLVVSIAVCTCSRFPPIWKQVRRVPPPTVGSRFFETAHHRAETRGPTDVQKLERALKRRRFRVWEVSDGGRQYLYADRYRWSPLATFVSHLALVMFLAGGMITWRMGTREDLLIAEGTTAPVFSLASEDHMQVKVLDFVREQDEEGRDIALYTDLAVFEDGELVAEGRSTINDPLTYGGYTFHQVAFAEDGAAIEVREGPGGPVIFSEVVQLAGVMPIPRVTVESAAGVPVFDGRIPPTFFLTSGAGGASLPLGDGEEEFAIAVHQIQGVETGESWRLAVAAPGAPIEEIALGESGEAGGYRFTFDGLSAANFGVVNGLPGAGNDGFLVQLLRGEDGDELVVVDDAGAPVRLAEGVPRQVAGLTYTFEGARDFSGITVRDDPGAGFIWVAAGMLLGGLMVTFALPRRRLWASVTGERALLAGIAPRGSGFGDELAAIARAAEDEGPAPPAERR